MIVDLYNSIFTLISNDETCLNYLSIDDLIQNVEFAPDLDEDERLLLAKAMKIQRQQIPKQLIESLPVITFYSIPSGRDPFNSVVYNGRIMVDIYTENDVDKALLISKRLFELFDGQFLDVPDTGSFRGLWIDGYESPTNDPDTYCFTNIFELSITIEN